MGTSHMQEAWQKKKKKKKMSAFLKKIRNILGYGLYFCL